MPILQMGNFQVQKSAEICLRSFDQQVSEKLESKAYTLPSMVVMFFSNLKLFYIDFSIVFLLYFNQLCKNHQMILEIMQNSGPIL